ncbi:MAG: HAD family phosphatase [Gammaproteobacteria bacterium]|nr:HAD family phosphatase [Gammaproteobacteria bacterium]
MPRWNYILWDHDGVLVDTEPWYFRATRRALGDVGIDLALGEYLNFMARGQSAWDLALKAGVSATTVYRHKRFRDEHYQQYLITEDIEIPGVDEVLTALGNTSAMAIVTTAKKADFELIHRSRNIVSHMEFVLMSGDYARSKPAPDPYLAALDRFEIDPSEAVVIEDSERGLRSAVAAGVDCIVVYNKFTETQNFSRASEHVDSLAELPGLING